MNIRTALSLIDTSSMTGAVYIRYVKKDGSIGEIKKATKGGQRSGNTERSNFKYRVKESKVALIFDAEQRRYRSIKIFRIISCNGQKANHQWN